MMGGTRERDMLQVQDAYHFAASESARLSINGVVAHGLVIC